MTTAQDHYRKAAFEATFQHLESNGTNTIARQYVWRAVQAALQAYEDEWARDAETRFGWCLMLEGKPLLTVPTKSIARHQRTLLARVLEVPKLRIRIVETQFAV